MHMTLPPQRGTPMSSALLLVGAVLACNAKLGNAGFASTRTSVAFVPPPVCRHPPPTDANSIRVVATSRLNSLLFSKDSSWDDDHLIHGAENIHEETDDELRQSEEDAAWDAHDASSDAGMEAASEERAVMLANEMAHKMKDKALNKSDERSEERNDWNEQHLAHGAREIHVETDAELKESEEAAVLDACDSSSDAGMEAAMMERSVMLANEMARKMKSKTKQATDEEHK